MGLNNYIYFALSDYVSTILKAMYFSRRWKISHHRPHYGSQLDACVLHICPHAYSASVCEGYHLASAQLHCPTFSGRPTRVICPNQPGFVKETRHPVDMRSTKQRVVVCSELNTRHNVGLWQKRTFDNLMVRTLAPEEQEIWVSIHPCGRHFELESPSSDGHWFLDQDPINTSYVMSLLNMPWMFICKYSVCMESQVLSNLWSSV